MPTLSYNYDVKWILDKTNPRFHDAMKKTLTHDLEDILAKELHGSSLSPAELQLRLNDPTSMESHLLFAHAVNIFIEESQKNALIKLAQTPEILEESIRVQKIPPIEWESEEARQILPDPKKMKEENKDLFEQLKREMAKLEKLREIHKFSIKSVNEREEILMREYRNDEFRSSIKSSKPSAFRNFFDNKVPEFFGSIRRKFNETMENASSAYLAYRASSGQAAAHSPEALRSHTDVQLKISFYGSFTDVAEGNAVIRPSDIRRMEREKNAQGQTRFEKVHQLSRDEELARGDKNAKMAEAEVRRQEKVVQEAARKLDASNKETKAVNDQSWPADKNKNNLRQNTTALTRAVGKDKSPAEALKNFGLAVQEKANKLVESAKKNLLGFVSSVTRGVSNLLNKRGSQSAREEIEMESRNRSQHSPSPTQRR